MLENGTACTAIVEVSGRSEYSFVEPGLLGERIPQTVSNITLSNATCDSCPFTTPRPSTIAFPPGNYTISYTAPIRDNHIQGTFEEPYRVQVFLPAHFDVRNPFLGVVGGGGEIEEQNGSLRIHWNATRAFEVRFYDRPRELLLIGFGTIWVSALIIFLVPYLLTRRGGRRA
ncbi:MAG: DUF5803 family protein [Methanomicrobiales archaeon]|nr:DUF5803 family protein [Methanomicrobiales archaeon]MDI6875842.1 DUF5803 family protein [Methanomicrobiales archaeon]